MAWALLVSVDQVCSSLQQGVVKYCAAFLAQGRIEEVNSTLSSSFLFALCLATLASVGIISALIIFETALNDLKFCLIVVAFVILSIVPLAPYMAILQAKQRYYIEAVLETASRYGGLAALATWFLLVEPSVTSSVIILGAALTLARLLEVPVAYRLVPRLQNSCAAADWKSFRMIFSFGSLTVLIALSLVANNAGLKWLMGNLVSASLVTHLTIVLMPGMLMTQVVSSMTMTIMPATSSYHAEENRLALTELLIRSVRYTTVLAVCSVLGGCILMKNLIVLWLGEGYAFLTPYAQVVFAAQCFGLSTSAAHHMLKGLGELWLTVCICWTSLAVTPLLLILVLYYGGYDAYFALASGLVSSFVLYGILNIYTTIRVLGINWWSMLCRAYVEPLLAASLFVTLAVSLALHDDWLSVYLRGMLSLGLMAMFLVTCYALISTHAERSDAVSYLKLLRSLTRYLGSISLKHHRY
ncbi:MAG: hypothetical protein V1792_09915 [Pseudomonadota bacterium]